MQICEENRLRKYNLLIGCPRERERAARSEMRYFVGDLIGDEDLRISRTHVSGLLAARTSLDPIEVVHQLKEFAEENPYQFRFAIRITPLELCVEADIDEITKAAESLLHKIEKDESYRVTVRRRHTDLEHMDIVSAIATKVDREVNLDHADKYVWVEVVGEWAGVSVLVEDEDILSIMTMRDDQY
ncbi:MAG: RNA methyltransferase [Candidatus Lokiarchaeota archaeon]|nr:RNA methyltransferase [Candidatus Lokiarchaeota archaeon]